MVKRHAATDEFVLDTQDWRIPELAELVAAGAGSALRVLDFDQATLWIKGKFDAVGDDAELDLTFCTDAHQEVLGGLVARLDAVKAVAEAMESDPVTATINSAIRQAAGDPRTSRTSSSRISRPAEKEVEPVHHTDQAQRAHRRAAATCAAGRIGISVGGARGVRYDAHPAAPGR